jgi:predicted esterase
MTNQGCARALLWAILLTLTLTGTAVAQTFRPGVLTPAVASKLDPALRYSVYLPTTFDKDKPAPILFILDYRGRARVAAEVFIPAAERFGWILMSSYNTTSDEAMTPSLVALQAMWTDAVDLFQIDPRRTYLAGLSGTARIATWVASQLPGTFTGVIGAAAGFAPLAPPSADTKFLYYGTVGNVDYNFWEMRQLEDRLSELGLPHRIDNFSGSHGWMPPDVAMAAVAWMELRAMKSGLRHADRTLIDALWEQDLEVVASLEEAGLLHAAFRALEAMASDYAGLRPAEDIAVVTAQSARLAAEPGRAAAARAREAAASAHRTRALAAMQTLADAFPVGDGAPVSSVARTAADLGIRDLIRSSTSRDQAESLAARRLLAELNVHMGFYLPVEALQAKEDARAAFYLEIARMIDPGDSFAWYLRARIHARSRRTADAIEALSRAVDYGFRTVDLLDRDAAFDSLRTRPDFQSLAAQVRARWDVTRRP